MFAESHAVSKGIKAFMETNATIIEKKNQKAHNGLKQAASIMPIKDIDFTGLTDCVKKTALKTSSTCNTLARRAVLVSSKQNQWMWDWFAWPFAATPQIVTGVSGRMLFVCIKLENLVETGMKSMASMGDFLVTMAGQTIIDPEKDESQVFFLEPGQSYFLPFGYVPFVLGHCPTASSDKAAKKKKDDEAAEPQISSCLVTLLFPEKIRIASKAIKQMVRQYMESGFEKYEKSEQYAEYKEPAMKWASELMA